MAVSTSFFFSERTTSTHHHYHLSYAKHRARSRVLDMSSKKEKRRGRGKNETKKTRTLKTNVVVSAVQNMRRNDSEYKQKNDISPIVIVIEEQEQE
jgi:ribosomal protein L19E